MFATIKRHGWLVSILRFVPIIAIASAVMAFSAPAALAINPHTVPSNPLSCTVVETNRRPAVQCTGNICGLGQGEVVIGVDVALACETRSGSNQPGGHLQATTEPITPEHGCVEVDVTTAAADCPRGLNPVVGEAATVEVFRASTGELLFSQDFPL